MLDKVDLAKPDRRKVVPFNVAIGAVATAVPAFSIGQQELKRRILEYYPQFAQLESIYGNTGIDRRYYCESQDWYILPRSWEERTAAFQHHALELLERVTLAALSEAGLALEQIDAVVVNTITGLAIPSLDAMLMNRLGFAAGTERLPIFGFGCGGGVAGLARAARIAQTMPGGNVLFLTIDLCTLCMRINDPSAAAFVAGALFGDGAAAVVLRNTLEPGTGDASLGQVVAMGEHLWPGTEYIMGWDIKNDGFGVVLSAELPNLIQARFGEAVDGFLQRNGLTRADVAGYLLHPGGARVLDAAERVLGLLPGALEPSRETLRNYGNMSSATALFILKYALDTGRRGRHLLAAFGPGFSAYFVLLDL